MNISELSNRILKTLEQIRSSLYSIFENINFDPSQKENVSTQFGELEKDIIDIKKAVDSIEWEKKTIKKFHFNNTLLMIFPTIISIGLIIFTVMKAPQNRRMVNNLRAISAYQNQFLYLKS